jgi:hypothetical protein
MTTSATAARTPARSKPWRRCAENRSLWMRASLAAVVAPRITAARSPHAADTQSAGSRVDSRTASPAANPAGSHATAIRRSG